MLPPQVQAVKMWLNKGVDPNKLVLGMPLYGRTFTLANPKNNGFLAPTVGPGPAGPATGESGYLGYNEVSIGRCLSPVIQTLLL